MFDEPKIELTSTPTFVPAVENEDRTFEEYCAYLISPDFTRRMSEHFKRATRRAIEEGRKLDLQSRIIALDFVNRRRA